MSAGASLAVVALVAASTGVGGSPLLGQRLPVVLILLVGTALLIVWPRTDEAAPFLRALAGTAIVFIAIFPQARGLRNELVLVPAAALGVALIAQRLSWLLSAPGIRMRSDHPGRRSAGTPVTESPGG